MDPATIFGIGQGLAGLLSLFKGKKDEQLNSPELLRLLRLQSGRMYAQNPLAESVAKMAFSRMPTGSRAGLEAPSLGAATAATSKDWLTEESDLPDELRGIMMNQETRFHLTDPLFQAIQNLVGSRMPMGAKPGFKQPWQDAGLEGPWTPPERPDEDSPGPDGPPTDPRVPRTPLPPTSFSNTPATNPWAVNYGRY